MWDIYYNEQIMGVANIKKEGLYYIIFCECTLPDDGVYRIVASDQKAEWNLGICVPTGNRFTLCARVPIKRLPGDVLSFRLVKKDLYENVYTVMTNQPFVGLEQLESARFQQDGEAGRIIIDPVPDQQGNDLNP